MLHLGHGMSNGRVPLMRNLLCASAKDFRYLGKWAVRELGE
jgi:hypothetical protein